MNKKLSIRGLLQTEAISETLKHACNTIDAIDISLHVSDDISSSINSLQSTPDILVIELDTNETNTIKSVIDKLKDLDGKTTTLILLNNSDSDVVRALMRAHAYDVIPLPCNDNELMKELRDIAAEKQQNFTPMASQVITFMNAKGGSGCTTLAVNTAYQLCNKYAAKVCLIDLDIQFGKVALFLDMLPAENIMNALNQPERIDSVFVKALISHHASGLDVLASPGALNDICNITPEAIESIIDSVSANYDYIIIDMPHVILPWSIAALKRGDRNLLIVQSCLSIMKDAKLLLDKLASFGIDKDRFELVNNRESQKTGMISKKQMLELLGKEDAFSVKNDYAIVIEAQETGKPMEKVSSIAGINRDIENLAKALKDGRKSNDKQDSLFSRIFHKRG